VQHDSGVECARDLLLLRSVCQSSLIQSMRSSELSVVLALSCLHPCSFFVHACLPFCFFEVRVLFMSDHYTSALLATNHGPPPLSGGSAGGPSKECVTAVGALPCSACIQKGFTTLNFDPSTCVGTGATMCSTTQLQPVELICTGKSTSSAGNTTGNIV
jgi:hypothetical protein